MALTEAEELELLELEELEAQQANQEASEQPGLADAFRSSVRGAFEAPAKIANALKPENAYPLLPTAGAIMGSAVAPGIGTAAGAGIGQILSRMADVQYGKVEPGDAMNPAEEWVGPATQAAVSGVVETQGAKALASVVGKGLTKIGSAFSGAKPRDLQLAAQKGFSTYSAPSMAKASDEFGEALTRSGINTTPTLEATLDPQLGFARKVAMEAGEKMSAGVTLTGEEALKARQAVDRVIAGTPQKDKPTLLALGNLRDKFNEELAKVSPLVQKASKTYADAILKRNLLKPLPVNKSGEYSKLAPYLAGVAGSALGVKEGDATKGVLAGGTYLLGTSPLTMGLAATTMGAAAASPMLRRALVAQFVDRIVTKRGNENAR